jgi:[ribosomal protein S5]-alanine N-acetyltransferase
LSAGRQPVLPAGDDVLLRPWEIDDAPALVAAYEDTAIQRWNKWRVDDEDEARQIIERWQHAWTAETGACWAVTRDLGLLGRMALISMALRGGRAECAYWVVASARGAGVATSALAAMTRWASCDAGFHRLELRHSVANTASCRVATKAGFALEGVLRGAGLHADGWHDEHLHAYLGT